MKRKKERKKERERGREREKERKNERKKGDFPGGTVVKNLPANAGDMGSSPGRGRSPTCCRTTKPLHHNY